jgi:hypothetical protein
MKTYKANEVRNFYQIRKLKICWEKNYDLMRAVYK